MSGWSITYAHSGIIKCDRLVVIEGLKLTIGLGILFSLIQYYEYNEASFNTTDSAYGSLFFVLTGFHGLHSASFNLNSYVLLRVPKNKLFVRQLIHSMFKSKFEFSISVNV